MHKNKIIVGNHSEVYLENTDIVCAGSLLFFENCTDIHAEHRRYFVRVPEPRLPITITDGAEPSAKTEQSRTPILLKTYNRQLYVVLSLYIKRVIYVLIKGRNVR